MSKIHFITKHCIPVYLIQVSKHYPPIATHHQITLQTKHDRQFSLPPISPTKLILQVQGVYLISSTNHIINYHQSTTKERHEP
jgi:hypothetical protein